MGILLDARASQHARDIAVCGLANHARDVVSKARMLELGAVRGLIALIRAYLTGFALRDETVSTSARVHACARV